MQFEDKFYRTEEELLDFINRNYPRYTPEEKLNNVLQYISKLTQYDGQAISIYFNSSIVKPEVWRKYYFQNAEEFRFYLENLRSQGLISYDVSSGDLLDLKIQLPGLTTLLKINERNNSRYCFVAMSFDDTLKHVYSEAILPALNETGFLPFILSDRYVKSEKTINDEIIAGLKAARFTIAEFTQHRQGVYFEAGFALGRGQDVIYVCSKSDIVEAHFDTRNFQHIVWSTTEDLKQQLINRIKATIIES